MFSVRFNSPHKLTIKFSFIFVKFKSFKLLVYLFYLVLILSKLLISKKKKISLKKEHVFILNNNLKHTSRLFFSLCCGRFSSSCLALNAFSFCSSRTNVLLNRSSTSLISIGFCLF